MSRILNNTKEEKELPMMVTFEISDDNYSVRSCSDKFKYFLKGCGINILDYNDPTSLWKDCEIIDISGVKFGVDYTKTSAEYKDRYKRTTVKRSKRFVLITCGYKNNIAKIHLNKEFDFNRIKRLINQKISETKEREENHKRIEKNNNDAFESLSKKFHHKDFPSCSGIRFGHKSVEIYINDGREKSFGSVLFDENLNFKSYHRYENLKFDTISSCRDFNNKETEIVLEVTTVIKTLNSPEIKNDLENIELTKTFNSWWK